MNLKVGVKLSVIFITLVIMTSVISVPIFANELELTEEEQSYVEENTVVLIGVDPSFRPYEFIDSDGQYKGIAADYLDLISQKTGLEFQVYTGRDWGETYNKALSGEIDMLPCIGITNERTKFFDFTESYFQFQRNIFFKDGSPNYKFKDLANIRVGVQRNSSHYSFLKDFDNIEPILYGTVTDLIMGLAAGEVDVIISNQASTIYQIKELGITDIVAGESLDAETTKLIGESVDSETNELAMAINPELKTLKSIIDKGLEAITIEERIAIRNKWIGVVKEADYSEIIFRIIVGLVVVGIIFTILAVYGYLLRREIKQRKAIEAELVIAKESAEKANEAKSTFLAHMSHEIRTPLNAITGLAFLLENTKTSHVQKKYIKNVKDASYNLLGIINDILDFSKIEAGEVEVEEVEFGLDQLLDKIGNLLMPKATAKGLGFHVKKDVRICDKISSDPTRIEQILINFVSNAIKFTHEGSVDIDVYMEEETLEGYMIKFSVRDTGIGITKKQKESLFKPFHQLDSSVTRKYGGTGLGLSISKKLVELLNGTINVESAIGKGSEFSFIIPVKCNREALVKKIYPDFREINVLIFDEDKRSTKIIGDYIASFKMHGTQVDNYQCALREISSGKYQLLIMELNIAGVDTIEFISTYATDITIVLVAKQVLESQYDQAQNIGVKHILMKPVISSILYNCLVQCFVKDFEAEKTIEILEEKKYNAKILLVEDNEVNQMIEKEILERVGYKVEIAENGQLAVDYIEAYDDVDIILMDIHMPVMDGYESTELIRKIDPDVPILAMTAISFSNIESKCKEVGMNGYVTKPVEPLVLYDTLEQHLSTRRPKSNNENKESVQVLSQPQTEESSQYKDYIDKKQGLMRIGNNKKLYLEVLEKFYDDVIKTSDLVSQHIKNEEIEEAKSIVHKIKGMSGNVGASHLFQSSKTLMDVLRNQIEVDLGPYIWEYESDLRKTLEAIQDILIHENGMVTTKKVDISFSDEEKKQILSLKKMLLNSDIDAFTYFDEVRNTMSHSLSEWNLVKEKMDLYQFKEAADILDKMI